MSLTVVPGTGERASALANLVGGHAAIDAADRPRWIDGISFSRPRRRSLVG